MTAKTNNKVALNPDAALGRNFSYVCFALAAIIPVFNIYLLCNPTTANDKDMHARYLEQVAKGKSEIQAERFVGQAVEAKRTEETIGQIFLLASAGVMTMMGFRGRAYCKEHSPKPF